MMRHFNGTLMAISGTLLLVLGTFQLHGVLSRRSNVSEKRRMAERLRLQADENNLPNLVRNPSKLSGRVFSAWEDLPLTGSFNRWDFYPNPRRARN